jgi:heptosyltransferase-2
MTQAASPSSRTLIISPNWIGDAVMAQPLLRLLKDAEPNRAIDVLAPGVVAPVWRAMSEVDTVIETPFKHGKLQLGERWKLARQLRKTGYASAYVLPNTLKFALIPWMAGIQNRIGYRGENRHGLINVMHEDDKSAPRPMVSFYAALAKAPSVQYAKPNELPRPSLHSSMEQQEQVLVDRMLQNASPLIVFAPGAEFGSAKRWPESHFAGLARNALRDNPRAQIVLLGSNKDHPVCEEIRAIEPRVRNLAGATTLDQAIALIASAAAVVSNDSGLLHIASALNKPVIALYGPTDPDHAPPFSDQAVSMSLRLECAPCKQRECPLGHHRCMKELSATMVWEPLQPMLKAQAVAS